MDRDICYEGKDHNRECGKSCSSCVSYGKDRRQHNRRRKPLSLKLRERRRGFDRRQNHLRKNSLYYRLFRSGAFYLKDSHNALIVLLVIFNLLNIADFFFTLKALSAGFIEANPVMDKMLKMSPFFAGVFKVAVIAFITTIIWAFRKYRLVLEISILFLLIYMLLISYHLYNAIIYY